MSKLRFACLCVPVGITFIDLVGRVAKVEGTSMQPTLNPFGEYGDYVFLSRWSVRNFEIKRGDIVAINSPKDPDQKLIKRVIAVSGDVVSTERWKRVRIPAGHCWIEGDHRGRSLDSNLLGPVAVGLVVARATHIVWPPSRWSCLDAPQK